MTAVRQKPVNALAFKRGGRGEAARLPAPPDEAPDPPEGLSEYAISVWYDFWSQDTAGAVNMQRDGERLRHWIRCVHERERLWELWSQNPLLKDRMGALKTNPLFRQIRQLSEDIERAETKFGMNPLDKMRLTGSLDEAERAEESIKARRAGRRPSVA